MKKLLLLIGLLASPSFGANIYLRSSASGANNGTSWTDAYTALPAMSAIARGDTVYVSSGSYGSVTLDKVTDGTQYITIKKATVADHGSSTGWSDSFASGVAYWTHMLIGTDYWVIDGVTGGGPGSWTSGHGFEFVIAAGSNWNFIESDDSRVGGQTHITVNHCYFHTTGDYDTDMRTNAIVFGGGVPAWRNSYLNFSYNYVYNISGLPYFFRFGDHYTIEYNYWDHTCGMSLGGGEQPHCENIVFWSVNDFQIRYNYIRDAISSGAIVKNEPDLTAPIASTGVYVYGNVFRSVGNGTASGILVCNSNSACSQWAFFNNTVAFLNTPNAILFAEDNNATNIGLNNIFTGGGTETFGAFMSPGRVHLYNYFADFVGGQGGVTGTNGCGVLTVDYSAAAENGGRGMYFGCDVVENTYSGGQNPYVNYTGTTPEDFKLSQHIPSSYYSYGTFASPNFIPISSEGVDVCQYLIDGSFPYGCDADHPFNVDMFGTTRGSTGGIWDRGMAQFAGGTPTVYSNRPSFVGNGRIVGGGKFVD